MLSCNKKGLSHSNWTVHLEPCWCKKSLTEKSITICVEHGHDFQRTFFFRFLNSSFSPPSSPAVSVVCSLLGLFVRFVSILCLVHLFSPSSRLSLLSIYFCFMCSKLYSLPSHQKILAWNTLLIEKSGRGKKKKKKRFPQFPWHGRPFNCSVCLSASWLCSPQHTRAPQSMPHAMLPLCTHIPHLARVTLPRPVNIKLLSPS